jgi:hypothetical protein
MFLKRSDLLKALKTPAKTLGVESREEEGGNHTKV